MVEAGEEVEPVDDMLWPLLPHFQMRAATLERGKLAYGTSVGVYQMVMTRVLLYVLQYDDGNIQYLEEARASAAEQLARTSILAERMLRRRCRRTPTGSGCTEAATESPSCECPQ